MQIFSYDDENMDRSAELQEDKSRVKTCRACGKLFVAELGKYKCRRKYCYRVHYAICPICGSEYVIDDNSLREPRKACSKECTGKLTHITLAKTMQEKYGVDNPSQHPEFHAKAVASINLKKDQIAAHLRQTMIDQYGGLGTASPILKEKIQNTIRDRYGVDNVSELQEVRDKISEALKSETSRAKYISTSQEHFGTDYPAQSDEVQYHMRKTCLERYGTEYVGSLPEVIEKRKNTSLERYGYTTYLSTDAAREQARKSILANFSGRVSKRNKEFGEVLSTYGIGYEFEYYLNRKWYDLHLKDTDIVIEIDPSYTHSAVPSHWSDTGLSADYHRMKTQKASECGYRCIHVFDWDNMKLIAQMLQAKEVIYARKCEVVKLTLQQAKEFIDVHHLQQDARGAKFCYGLTYNDELVCAMTFGRPRYTSKYQWELLRLCTLPGKSVVGGASRMFKQFLQDANPQSIISYCDLSKFSGEVYLKLGFKLDHVSAPSKVWSKGDKRITDNLLRQRGYDQLFDTDYGKGTDNEKLMIENGWLPVYDCGQAAYIYVVDSDQQV